MISNKAISIQLKVNRKHGIKDLGILDYPQHIILFWPKEIKLYLINSIILTKII